MALTNEQEAEISKLLGKGDGSLTERINDAIGGRITRFVEKELPGQFEKLGNGLAEKLRAAIPEPKPGDDKGGKGTGSDDVDVRIKTALETERATHNKRMQAIEDERKIEKQQRQREEERTAITRALLDAGVDSKRVRGALALIGEEQLVKRDNDGRIVVKVRKGSGAAAFDDEVDVADGIKSWLGTEDGKLYLPPKGAKGSGSSPATGRTTGGGGGGGAAATGGNVDPKVATAHRKNLARSALAHALEFEPVADDGEGE